MYSWFECKLDLLNCTISLIFTGEKNFKPYANLCLFKVLDYLTDEEWMKRKLAINIVYTLVFYCKKYNCYPKTVKIACKENNIEVDNKNIFKRKIRRIDKNGNYKDYESIRSASHDFINKPFENARENIQQALRDDTKTAYGYKWIYLD